MSELSLMISIIDRARLPEFAEVYRNRGIELNTISLGHGTASNEVLNYLGLTESEKAVLLSVVTNEVFRKIKRDLETKIRIDIPGIGIVFTVPMSSIGGQRELRLLTEGQHFEKGEESVMKDTAHELLIAISNQGYNDTVMRAARAGGAAGGTVIHAQGTGNRKAEQFLGISLASEKDVIMIVVKRSQRNAIMQAIMKEAGLETKAKTIVFSLPVSDTAGLRLLEDEPEEEAFPSDVTTETAPNVSDSTEETAADSALKP